MFSIVQAMDTLKIFLFVGMLLCGLGMMSACIDKDDSELIIGAWQNTAPSSEITIAGQNDIPSGVIDMEFTADSVRIADLRTDCLPMWVHYSLVTENDTRKIYIDNHSELGSYLVSELSHDKMILTSVVSEIDNSFVYTMKRVAVSAQSER